MYRDDILKRYRQLHNRLIPFHSDGRIIIEKEEEELQLEESDTECIEFALEVLEDLFLSKEPLIFKVENYDQSSSNEGVEVKRDFIIDCTKKAAYYRENAHRQFSVNNSLFTTPQTATVFKNLWNEI